MIELESNSASAGVILLGLIIIVQAYRLQALALVMIHCGIGEKEEEGDRKDEIRDSKRVKEACCDVWTARQVSGAIGKGYLVSGRRLRQRHRADRGQDDPER